MWVLLALFMAGLAIGSLVGLRADRIGTALGLMDYPDPKGGRKLHGKATPLLGGTALGLTALFSIGWILVTSATDQNKAMYLWLLFSVGGLILVGSLDDRFGLSARFRLIIAPVIMASAISQVPDFAVRTLIFTASDHLILFGATTALIFSLVGFVGLLNAVNMADGKNGMVLGQAIIWALVLLVRCPDSTKPIVATLLGTLIALFVFNMRGKLFLGDGGSYGLSALFGLLTVHAWNHGFAEMRAEDLALIFALPVLDTLRLIVLRLSRGVSPFTPGRDHLHHYLFDRWGWPAPLWWVMALVAIPNLGSILLPQTGGFWLILTIVGYILMIGMSVREKNSNLVQK